MLQVGIDMTACTVEQALKLEERTIQICIGASQDVAFDEELFSHESRAPNRTVVRATNLPAVRVNNKDSSCHSVIDFSVGVRECENENTHRMPHTRIDAPETNPFGYVDIALPTSHQHHVRDESTYDQA